MIKLLKQFFCSHLWKEDGVTVVLDPRRFKFVKSTHIACTKCNYSKYTEFYEPQSNKTYI
jgi:predicted nucleic-acid-binding Zn-ribbon protein